MVSVMTLLQYFMILFIVYILTEFGIYLWITSNAVQSHQDSFSNFIFVERKYLFKNCFNIFRKNEIPRFVCAINLIRVTLNVIHWLFLIAIVLFILCLYFGNK